MAGVKGRSGGARPNTGGPRPNSGGKREGAGRPPKAENEGAELMPDMTGKTPLEVLQEMMWSAEIPVNARIKAAAAAAQYMHAKKGEGGKKEATQEHAEKVSAGRFATAERPKLVVNNG